MALDRGSIVAVGNNLQHDREFRSYVRIDLKGKCVTPGFVDAHTHFYFFALTMGQLSLDGIDSIEECLDRIESFAATLSKNQWVFGEGYSPDNFKRWIEPDRWMLDRVSGGRPAFIFSKDEHTAWVSSRALEMAGMGRLTREPAGGAIGRTADGELNGILRERAAYGRVFDLIDAPSNREIDRRYEMALDHAYRNGVTGVHSFDRPDAFPFFERLMEQGKIGLRVNHYPSAELLPVLRRNKVRYGQGDGFFRIAGVKIFSDGSLGSQSALCFDKYAGTESNYGLEVASISQMVKWIKSAARLGMPAAIHAIGDRGVANVLDAIEQSGPLESGVRHRIEHLQLVRRKDLARLKRLGVVASMQPSHCPSDIGMIRKYWGKRGNNAFIFRTLLDKKIDLAFGSDCPIEPLDPIAGIAAAVRRAKPGSRDVFYPQQRLSAAEALYNFTVGPAIASGQEHCRGYLLPGYPADYVVLSDDITRIAASRLYDVKVLATVLDGKVRYADSSMPF